jgi:hypothetical protein
MRQQTACFDQDGFLDQFDGPETRKQDFQFSRRQRLQQLIG